MCRVIIALAPGFLRVLWRQRGAKLHYTGGNIGIPLSKFLTVDPRVCSVLAGCAGELLTDFFFKAL